MKTDDDDDSAGFETVVQNAPQCCFELFELVIDGNAQGLKYAGGRVAMASLTCRLPRTAGRRPVSRSGAGNRVGQVKARAYRSMLAPFDDAAGHPAAVRFFAVAFEQFHELAFVEPRDKSRCGLSLCDVKPQIKGTVGGETEST